MNNKKPCEKCRFFSKKCMQIELYKECRGCYNSSKFQLAKRKRIKVNK